MDNLSLARWRQLSAVDALRFLADYAKQDAAFNPRANEATTRWHVAAGGREFEFLCTGTKFFDTRAHKGGGGGVDLAMHLFDLDFKSAVKLLQERGL